MLGIILVNPHNVSVKQVWLPPVTDRTFTLGEEKQHGRTKSTQGQSLASWPAGYQVQVRGGNTFPQHIPHDLFTSYIFVYIQASLSWLSPNQGQNLPAGQVPHSLISCPSPWSKRCCPSAQASTPSMTINWVFIRWLLTVYSMTINWVFTACRAHSRSWEHPQVQSCPQWACKK